MTPTSGGLTAGVNGAKTFPKLDVVLSGDGELTLTGLTYGGDPDLTTVDQGDVWGSGLRGIDALRATGQSRADLRLDGGALTTTRLVSLVERSTGIPDDSTLTIAACSVLMELRGRAP